MSMEAAELVFQTRQTLKHYDQTAYNSGVGIRTLAKLTSQHAWEIFNSYYYYTRIANPLYTHVYFPSLRNKKIFSKSVFIVFFSFSRNSFILYSPPGLAHQQYN